MKKKHLIYLLFFLLIASFSSCQDDEAPAPAPQAAFSQNRAFIERNETVSFTNNSTGATRFEWDFGDGQTSTDPNPTIKFPRPGNFKITLTAYNQNNEATTATATLKVGVYRILSKVEIIKLNFQNSSGLPWDADGTGPDVTVYFKPGQWSTQGAGSYTDLTPSSLPAIWTPSGIGSTPVENENWYIRLEDIDNPYHTHISELMFEGNVNPYQAGVKSYTDGKGYFILEDAQKQVKVIFHFDTV